MNRIGGCRLCAAVVGVLALPWAAGPASARDLPALTRLLTPAYAAMSYAGVCAMQRQWTAAQPRGRHGTAINYAEHIKNEVVASLSDEDARTILTAAADTARRTARMQLRENVTASDKREEDARLTAWCAGYVSDFIADVIRRHDADHTSFLERLRVAKQAGDATQNP
ncbi:hypothetical protein MXD81_03505 [Microbacteriaceae bacterium K1510]|nr:hypothetical protein [Microbacteriaceae bacterium K1510]